MSAHGGPLRFCAVNGFDGRTNDMLYSPPIEKPDSNEESSAVVYFGGDVQVWYIILNLFHAINNNLYINVFMKNFLFIYFKDFPENMETNFESKAYLRYNLESTALNLRRGFPKSHIIVIRPSRWGNNK